MWPDLFGDMTAMEIVKHSQILIVLPSFPPSTRVSNLSQFNLPYPLSCTLRTAPLSYLLYILPLKQAMHK